MFNNITNIFYWVPLHEGTFSFNVRVADGLLADEKTFTITVQPERPAKLNLVYYGNHDAEVYAAIIEARPEFLIGNTAHGLWGAINSHSADWLLQDTAKFKATGIKVIGYITAGYEGQGSNGDISSGLYTQEKNLEFISDMAEMGRTPHGPRAGVLREYEATVKTLETEARTREARREYERLKAKFEGEDAAT